MPRIAGVAALVDQTVYCRTFPSEHASLGRLLPEGSEEKAEYGYLTDDGRFLKTTEAVKVAAESGQVLGDKSTFLLDSSQCVH